jgi:hypothetical protein
MDKPKTTENNFLKKTKPSFKSIKMPNIYKDMYSSQTAQAIKDMKISNQLVKSDVICQTWKNKK